MGFVVVNVRENVMVVASAFGTGLILGLVLGFVVFVLVYTFLA
jgi:hypothetical protein